MIWIKPGVRLVGARPQIILAMRIVEGAYQEAGVADLWITSGADSVHSVGSRHYAGDAFDARTKEASSMGVDIPALAAKIKAGLGEDFDVVLEAQGTDNEHLHVEFHPKRPL